MTEGKPLNSDPMEKVRRALEQGSLSEAIRAYREATGVSPQEAMAAVEQMTHQPGLEVRSRAASGPAFEPDSIESLERRIVRPAISGGLAALIGLLVAVALVLLLLLVMHASPTPVPR